ncbi:MAG: uracil-DNA glycosylase [Ilumatobacter sp.]|jgi:uracil-DNA glycosylase|uniref:uracil-DNA glycosylase n=1 Tax=Ilumatobacter sp. TaxID=1967498 RepID=UPI00391D59A9
MSTTDWNPLLRGEFDQPYWIELQRFVARERAEHSVYPPHDEVFAAIRLTSFAETKVVILGQDPYHGPRQAHGLAFSVRHGTRVPPSLQNIHRELRDDLALVTPDHGNLEAWARRGVLLLNTSLTVRAGQAGSHAGKGWETFTDRVIDVVAAKPEPVVFVLWGNHARAKKGRIDTTRHRVIESPHPSPFSARNGFFGSRPFSRTNAALEELGSTPIDWNLDEQGGEHPSESDTN